MRQLHDDRHGYDSDTDNWYTFNSPEESAAWLAEFDPSPDWSIKTEVRTTQAAPAFNAYSIGVTCPAAATYGPIINVAQADEGRLRLLISCIIPAGSFLIIGTREGVSAGQGYCLSGAVGGQLELQNTRAVWAALALGSAVGPLTGTVGLLTESLAG